MYLSSIRNFCAHGNRLFCYESKKKELNDTPYHKKLNIEKSNDKYVLGKRDLFAVMISLRILLSHNDYKRLKGKLIKSIKILSKDLKTLSVDEILNIMGFPKNWTNL